MEKLKVFYLMVGLAADVDIADREIIAYGPYPSYEMCMEYFGKFWDQNHEKLNFLMTCQPERNLPEQVIILTGRL